MTRFVFRRRHIDVLAIIGSDDVEAGGRGRAVVVAVVFAIRIGVADVEADRTARGQETLVPVLGQDCREDLAFVALAVGQLDLVVAAGAEAGRGDVGVGRRDAPFVLQLRITTGTGRIDRAIDRTTIDGVAIETLRGIDDLRQIDEIHRVHEPRVNEVEVEAPVTQEAGGRSKVGGNPQIGTPHGRLLEVRIGRLRIGEATGRVRRGRVDHALRDAGEGPAGDNISLGACGNARSVASLTEADCKAVVGKRVRHVNRRVAAGKPANPALDNGVRDEPVVIEFVGQAEARQNDRIDFAEAVGVGEAITIKEVRVGHRRVARKPLDANARRKA